MTRQKAKEVLSIVQAFGEGKMIQYRRLLPSSAWIDCDYTNPNLSFDDAFEYRIKPEPSYRPWTPEEVPVGCLLKHKKYEEFYTKTLLICVRGAWCHFMREGDAKLCEHTTTVMLDCYHHSTDNGKTWQPCGVPV